MTGGDREALDKLRLRFDQTAAIAKLLADNAAMSAPLADGIRGIAETLDELATQMDRVLNPALAAR